MASIRNHLEAAAYRSVSGLLIMVFMAMCQNDDIRVDIIILMKEPYSSFVNGPYLCLALL